MLFFSFVFLRGFFAGFQFSVSEMSNPIIKLLLDENLFACSFIFLALNIIIS